jgi:hypothetical protein
MPIPAFAPVLSPPLVSEVGVEASVEELAVEVIVFVPGLVLDMEAVELVGLDKLVVVAVDEMLNAPETATGLVAPS